MTSADEALRTFGIRPLREHGVAIWKHQIFPDGVEEWVGVC